jgi:hypothetical protein
VRSREKRLELAVDIEQLSAVLDELRGGTVYRARIVQDTVLAFLVEVARDRVWSIRVFSVAWRIESGERIVVGNDDSDVVLRARVRILDRNRLVNVTVRAQSMDTSFDFGDLQLRVFPVTSVVDRRHWQQWSARLPDGDYLYVGPGSSWTRKGDAHERG